MNLNRRQSLFAAGAAASVSLIPGKVLGANGKVDVAWIGVGNRGPRVIQNFENSGILNVVALCDVHVDNPNMQAMKAKYPNAKVYQDWRKLFDEMSGQFDAVINLTPDHQHFPISMVSMAHGKHVYTEKPLARTFQEIDLLMAAEKKYGVVTQMGNQGHSGDNYYQFKAWKEAGIIKDVTHVDAYMNKWRRWHPWGDLQAYPTGAKQPAGLDWEIWKGVTPLDNVYDPKFHPGNWRGWYQYGTGCFGDWGAHILDTIHQFLELGMPSTITASKLVQPNDIIFPLESTINFAFPARGDMPAMDIDWYDGAENKPPVPKEWGDKGLDPKEPGKFIYSKDYVFQGGTHSDKLQVIPYEKYRELLKTGSVPRDFGKNPDHYASFLLACRGEVKTTSPFSVSGPLSQVLALGCLAQRLGGTLEFDRETRQITNNKLANSLLKDHVRKGWEQYYKL
ncbi:Gfo/Idh/MocA family oxidoreductase [Pontiellaceae bacterium B12227]|nr:Gfo/Idh/MocA family oxidoreductase [Pontiellaceae bacterium B12227]